MGHNRYENNPEFFYRNGHRIPGGRVKSVPIPKVKEESPAQSDRENRQKVLNAIDKAVENGEDLEKIIEDLVLEYEEEFAYLTNNGINLKEVFANWYKGFLKGKEKTDRLNESR